MSPAPAPPPASSGDASGEYWFCLKHHTVEGREGCRNADRLGPYPTPAAAARALETVEERNEAWEDADERWEHGDSDGSGSSGGPDARGS